MTAGISGLGPRYGEAVVIEFHELRDATTEGRMSAIYAGIEMSDADACPCEAALPASPDSKPLQPPSQSESDIGTVH